MLPNFSYLTNEKIDQIPIDNENIVSRIRKLNPNKANGSDGISGQMLLLCDDSVVLPLRIIFGNILSTATYPDIWKLANVPSIFKKGAKQIIVVKFSKRLSGFLSGDSTTILLIDLVDEIHQAFDSKKPLEVCVVFLDISKAFDKVWHDGLLFKRRQNGISAYLLKRFQNYLSNRKQRVVLNGFSSDYSSIDSGVPQGSVLGPLLFPIYTLMILRKILNPM